MKFKFNISILGDIFIVILIILSSLITLNTLITNKDGIPSIKGYSPFSIQSNSMYPALKKGDLIISNNNIDIYDLKVDDIISFYAYEDGVNIIKTHRITRIIEENDTLLFETKGDNNDIDDGVLITEVDIIGKMEKKIPFVGGLIDILKKKWVFLIFILIPLFIFFIYQLYEFIRLLIEYKMEFGD